MSLSSRSSTQTILVKPSRLDGLLQLLRFCIVGGLNTLIDLIVFNMFVQIFPTQNIHHLILYNSIAYFVGAFNSFCWNKLDI